MRVQLWSYNYDPEPTGIAPISAVWAREMAARGHDVEVIAAHPHYPAPVWGRRRRPYKEMREGVPVTRLPLVVGRDSTLRRIAQEVSYTASLSLAAPHLGQTDAIVAVSPCFPALAPAVLAARLRRVPLVIWLQDILPDGAVATGLLPEGRAVSAAYAFERWAYRSAARVAVISDSFEENLRNKGVPSEKLARIYNPATRPILDAPKPADAEDPRMVLTMGNVGHSQGLVEHIRAFQESSALEALGARFRIAGDGVAGDAVRSAITTDRVEITGIVDSDRLERELQQAAVASVSQLYSGEDFNVPSKLMNFMAYGLPVAASVRPTSEVARIVERSGAGWVTDSADPKLWAEQLTRILAEPAELRRRRGADGLAFARDHFSPSRLVDRFEQVLTAAIDGSPRPLASRESADALAA